jgi:hypothetical protein
MTPMRAAPRLFKEPFAVWLPANSSTGTAGRARRPAFAVIDVNYTLGGLNIAALSSQTARGDFAAIQRSIMCLM